MPELLSDVDLQRLAERYRPRPPTGCLRCNGPLDTLDSTRDHGLYYCPPCKLQMVMGHSGDATVVTLIEEVRRLRRLAEVTKRLGERFDRVLRGGDPMFDQAEQFADWDLAVRLAKGEQS